MFLTHAVKVWRLVPTPFFLICASSAPWFARLVIQYAFPAKLFTEYCTQLLSSIIDRAEAVWARPFIFIVREPNGVIILHALACSLGCPFGISKITSEPCGPKRIHIHWRFALNDPFRHELAHAARATVAVE